MADEPNPKKEEKDGTITLTYRQTQEQKDRQAVEDGLDAKAKAQGQKAKEAGTDMAR